MTGTEGQDHPNNTASTQDDKVFLWSYIALATLCSIVGMLGNGLVVYLASQNPKRRAFVYLNKVVRNLAVTDFLFCVLAIPLTAVWYFWGKFGFYLV